MNWIIEFEVVGNPIALKRHRTVKKGKFTGTYDPSEGDKADFLIKSMENKPTVPYNEPLYVSLTFFFRRPKAHLNSKGALKPKSPIWHTGTPDADNLAKFVCDALNGMFWYDDRCISELHVRKLYSICPRVKIRIGLQSELNLFT
jgi:Holliday junction resolvase RusA-like endonuclease